MPTECTVSAVRLGAAMSRQAVLDQLRTITEAPSDYARQWKRQTGRPIIGTLCSYVPEEIVLAGGAMPFRLLPNTAEFSRADTCLQTYACCLARGILEQALTDRLNFLDGLIFGNTCDTMQCLADIWHVRLENQVAETFMMPVHVSHSAARGYLIAEISRLIDSLNSHLGLKVDRAALSKTIADCRTARQALAKLYDLQRGPSPVLSPRQIYDVALARWFMPPAEYTAAVTAIMDDHPSTKATGPRVVVVGGPLLDASLADVLEELGASWVGDDLCTGARATWAGPDVLDDPIAAIADRLLTRPPCPAKHLDGYDPGRPVVDRAREAGADGIVVYRLKFCDPHAFDYPRLKEALDEASLPNILIEVETSAGSAGQLRTRLQAFLEMITDGVKAEAGA
jgi:benzoyl-CoA reductase subunit C